uniref:Uncharacterized protein n=1 Tax=Oryza rufipogon TaxID=4529 RepID=A0A0E0NJH9_ORYRU
MMRYCPLCLKCHRRPTSPPFSASGPLSPRFAPPMRRCLLHPPLPPRPSDSPATATDVIPPPHHRQAPPRRPDYSGQNNLPRSEN